MLAEFKFREENDEEDGRDVDAIKAGWAKARGPVWAKVIDVDTVARQTPYESLADNAVRQVSLQGKQYGLYVQTNDGKWDKQNVDRAKDNLTHHGIDGGLQKDLLGWISDNPFYLVARPFAGEYPGDREWNLLGSKLLYAPAEADGPTTHWDMVLNHVGRGLDAAVESDPWCQEYNVGTGADYLRMWIANLIRLPARRLPMLAMYSPEQGTGKSTLHEATAVLFDEKGFEYGDAALKNDKGFNGELEGRALCAVEETNLANCKEAYMRIKSWVTSPRMQVTYKHGTSFTTDNYTHWVLSTQNIRSIPIEPGDTRIVLWEVTPYEGKDIHKENSWRNFARKPRSSCGNYRVGPVGRGRPAHAAGSDDQGKGTGDESRRGGERVSRPGRRRAQGGRSHLQDGQAVGAGSASELAKHSATGTARLRRNRSRAGRTRWAAILRSTALSGREGSHSGNRQRQAAVFCL